MEYLLKNKLHQGYNDIVTADCDALDYIELAIVNLGLNEGYEEELEGRELVGVILSGKCSIRTNRDDANWIDIGERKSVFDGKATGFYLPAGTEFALESNLGASVALCRAPSQLNSKPFLVPPGRVRTKNVGRHNWRRKVHSIIDGRHNCSHLLVGETFTPPGNWSSYPPHKHDIDDPPREVNMEEVYHFRLAPEKGFGIQRLYDDERTLDEIYVVNDGDTVLIPNGYHPVAAAPGYRMYYLWILAGASRELAPRDDPDMTWLKNCEPIIDNI